MAHVVRNFRAGYAQSPLARRDRGCHHGLLGIISSPAVALRPHGDGATATIIMAFMEVGSEVGDGEVIHH
jgi:hypothetical protein